MEEELEDEEEGNGLQVEYVEDFEESDDEGDIEEVAAAIGSSAIGARRTTRAPQRAPRPGRVATRRGNWNRRRRPRLLSRRPGPQPRLVAEDRPLN